MDKFNVRLLFLLCNFLCVIRVSLGQDQLIATTTTTTSRSPPQLVTPTFTPQSIQSPELLNELNRIRNHFQTLSNSEKLIALDKITSDLKLAPNFVAQLLYKVPLPVPVPILPTASISEGGSLNLNSTSRHPSSLNLQNISDSGSSSLVSASSASIIQSSSNGSDSKPLDTNNSISTSSTSSSLATDSSVNSFNASAKLFLQLRAGSSNYSNFNSNFNLSQSVQNPTVPVPVQTVLRVPPPGTYHTGSNVSDTNIENGYGALILNHGEGGSGSGDGDNNNNGTFDGTKVQESTDDTFDDNYWKDKIEKLVADIGDRCNIIYC